MKGALNDNDLFNGQLFFGVAAVSFRLIRRDHVFLRVARCRNRRANLAAPL